MTPAIIACRRTKVGLAVAEIADELHVPLAICENDCPQDHARDCDGILYLTNRNPSRVGAETLERIGEAEKPAVVVAVGGQDVEFVRKWIARKRIGNLFVTGDASPRASRRFMRAVLGGEAPHPSRLAGLLARIFHDGWRCRALELE